MNCKNCGQEQGEGKFCQKCGAELEHKDEGQKSQEIHNSAEESQTDSDILKRVKKTSVNYWEYFLKYLKKPSHIFKVGAKEKNNGIISIILTALIFALAFYSLVKPVIDYLSNFHNISFLSIFVNVVISLGVVFAIVIALLFFINKLISKEEIDFHTVIAIYGTYLIPVILINLAALLFAILASEKLTLILLFLSVFLVSLLIPLHIITRFLTQAKTKLDSYYAYLIYFGSLALSFYILGKFFADSKVMDLIDIF